MWVVFRHLQIDSFKLGMMIGTAMLFILMSAWMILTLIQGHTCLRNRKILASIFSEILQSIWMRLSMLPQPVGLLKLVLNLFCTKDRTL